MHARYSTGFTAFLPEREVALQLILSLWTFITFTHAWGVDFQHVYSVWQSRPVGESAFADARGTLAWPRRRSEWRMPAAVAQSECSTWNISPMLGCRPKLFHVEHPRPQHPHLNCSTCPVSEIVPRGTLERPDRSHSILNVPRGTSTPISIVPRGTLGLC